MLDWRTGEEKWEAAEGQVDRPSRGPKFRIPRTASRWLLIAVTVVVVAAGGAAVFLRWKSNQKTVRLRQDIQATVDTQVWALETHNLELYWSLLDPAAHPGWQELQERTFEAADGVPAKMTVSDVMLFGSDLAVAELNIIPENRQPYRATRAYRRSGGMWLETSIPAGQVWVDQVSRETENLRFIFHRRDEPRVLAAMPAIQDLYVQLLDDLRLSPPQGKRTLYVILSVRPIDSELPDDPTYYDLADLGDEVDTEVVKRRLGALLLNRIMALFRSDQGDLSFLVRAVEDWEYAAWLDALPVPGGQAAYVQDTLVSLPFMSLTDRAWKSLEHPASRVAAGQALVGYVVRTYGRTTLDDIVRGARRYDDWYPFVTHALQVSQVLRIPFFEFDAGWQDYALRTFTDIKGTRLSPLMPEKTKLLRLVAEEQQAVEQGNLEDYLSLLSGDDEWKKEHIRRFEAYQDSRRRTDTPFRLDLKDTIVRGEEALLRVEVYPPDPDSSLPYQEIRSYRRVNDEWKWAATEASFWGATGEEETSHLRFRFNRQDAEIIREEMPATEAFFMRISHDLDLAPRLDEWLRPRIGIHVVPDYRVLDWRGAEDDVAVLSPTLGAIATEMPAPDFYRMTTGLALSRKVISAQAGEAKTPFADALFEAVARWETEQWAPGLPWTEPRSQRISEMLRSEAGPSLRGRLTWVELRADPMPGPLYDTVVAYLAETYGRTELSKVVHKASQHQSWETLVPDALGVDFEEFEAGWQEYLRQIGG